MLTRTLTGIIGADDVQLSRGTSTFDTANAGLGKTVTLTGATLIGTGASNYRLTDANIGTVPDITPATVTVSDYAGVYDGLAHGATIVGVPGEDLSSSLIMT